jgi:hypothetical protein
MLSQRVFQHSLCILATTFWLPKGGSTIIMITLFLKKNLILLPAFLFLYLCYTFLIERRY